MSEVEGREEAETEETPEDSAPRVKMPQARDISRSEFTPHALSPKGRTTARSGTRKAAKRRQIIYTVVGVVVVAAVVTGGVWWVNRPKPQVKIEGAFGKAPVVKVPHRKPDPKQTIKEVIHGSGPKISGNDFVIAHLVAVQWTAKGDKKQVLSTFEKGRPVAQSASQLTGLAALDKAVPGHTRGTRLELTLPYKSVGTQVAQALQLAGTDDLILSVDLVDAFGKNAAVQGTQTKVDSKLPQVTPGAPGQPPTVKMPSGSAPSKLSSTTLIEGTGKPVARGQTLIAQYEGVVWSSGKVFDSSWKHGSPAGFPIGAGQVIPGWDKTLVGKKIGSRVLLVIPPKEGYGDKGQPAAGIKGTDTLVFVVDILGAV